MTDKSKRGWLPGALVGLLFGVFMGIFAYVQDRNGWVAVILAVMAGAVFGFAMDRVFRRQRRDATRQLGPLAQRLDRRTVRNAVRGPVPPDPAQRQEQLQIVEFQLEQAQRNPVLGYLVFGTLTPVAVVQAITTSPWFWLGAALFAYLLVITPITLARLKRRRVALTAAT